MAQALCERGRCAGRTFVQPCTADGANLRDRTPPLRVSNRGKARARPPCLPRGRARCRSREAPCRAATRVGQHTHRSPSFGPRWYVLAYTLTGSGALSTREEGAHRQRARPRHQSEAQLPAERSEERRLPLAGQRVCGVKGVWGHHCDSSIVWGGAGRSPSGVPACGLTRNRPDSVTGQQQPGLFFLLKRQRDREPRKRLAQQPACQRWRCYAHSPCGLPSRRCVATLAQRPHHAPRPRVARSAPPTARTPPSRTFAARRMPMPLCARRRWPCAPTRPRACSRPTSRRSRTRR